jgi:DNA repair protein RecO (recombination protein O)
VTIVATDAVVLHVFDYLETSRIYRLLTRDAGLQSVLARGARRPHSRFGKAIDLFAEGAVQLSVRPTRELQTLTAFDVTRSRSALAADLERFTAAAAIVELVLRFVRDEAHPALYDVVSATLDEIADAAPSARDAALAGAWRLIAELGFAPSVDSCGGCHESLSVDEAAAFSYPAGGVLCTACAGLHGQQRMLPAAARGALRAWLSGEARAVQRDGEGRAHQRLLREFVEEHLIEGRALQGGAFEIWARGSWAGPSVLDRSLAAS